MLGQCWKGILVRCGKKKLYAKKSAAQKDDVQAVKQLRIYHPKELILVTAMDTSQEDALLSTCIRVGKAPRATEGGTNNSYWYDILRFGKDSHKSKVSATEYVLMP